MRTYLLFGLTGNDLADATTRIQCALGIAMSAHESSYRGGEYYRARDVGEEHFILQTNFDFTEGDWAEPQFSEHALLLYANEVSDAVTMVTALAPIAKLLRRRDVGRPT